MSNKLPYEEALERQFNDLPLPNEDNSWQAMNALLDKDDKRSFPAGFINYGGFVLCGLAIIGWSWILLRKNEIREQKLNAGPSMVTYNAGKNNKENISGNSDYNTAGNAKTLSKTDVEKINQQQNNTTSLNSDRNPKKNKNFTTTPNVITGNEYVKGRVNNGDVSKSNSKYQHGALGKIKNKTGKTLPSHTKAIEYNLASFEKTNSQGNKNKGEKSASSAKNNNNGSGKKTQHIAAAIAQAEKNSSNAQNGVNNLEKENEPEASKNLVNTKIHKADTLSLSTEMKSTEHVVSSVKKDTSVNNDNKNIVATKPVIKPAKKAKGLVWSIGAGVQQQIPVGGQKIVAYGYNGSKSIVDDYIPHIYLRAEKPQKWFAQAEFSYGAPQSVPAFAYNRKTKLNESFTQMTTTTLSLKKTYYHEIPLSFNYFIKPNWSVGAGVMYSLLHRSIAEQQTTIKNVQTQEEISSVRIMPSAFTDSFLYKSKWHWLVQTTYDWHRFSFGLRYVRDAESYIKYTLPNGEMNERKNWSLECFVRFRLWESR